MTWVSIASRIFRRAITLCTFKPRIKPAIAPSSRIVRPVCTSRSPKAGNCLRFTLPLGNKFPIQIL
jgi:hypothetical protein